MKTWTFKNMRHGLYLVMMGVCLGLIVCMTVGCDDDDDNGPSGPEGINMTGTWTQTDLCDPLMVFDLTQDGENLTGTARDTTGAVLGPLSGTITGNSVFLEMPLPLDQWFRYDLTVSGVDDLSVHGRASPQRPDPF